MYITLGGPLLILFRNVFVLKDVGGKLLIQYDVFNQEEGRSCINLFRIRKRGNIGCRGLVESRRPPAEVTAQEYYDEWNTMYASGNIAGVAAKYEPDAARIMSGAATVSGIPGKQYIVSEVHGTVCPIEQYRTATLSLF